MGRPNLAQENAKRIKRYLQTPRLKGKIDENLEDKALHEEFIRLSHPIVVGEEEKLNRVNEEFLLGVLGRAFKDKPNLWHIKGKRDREEKALEITDFIAREALRQHHTHDGWRKEDIERQFKALDSDPNMARDYYDRLVFREFRYGTQEMVRLFIDLSRDPKVDLRDMSNENAARAYARIIKGMNPIHHHKEYLYMELSKDERKDALFRIVEKKFKYRLNPNADSEQVRGLWELGIRHGYTNHDILYANQHLFDPKSLPKKYQLPSWGEAPPPEYHDILDEYKVMQGEQPAVREVRGRPFRRGAPRPR